MAPAACSLPGALVSQSRHTVRKQQKAAPARPLAGRYQAGSARPPARPLVRVLADTSQVSALRPLARWQVDPLSVGPPIRQGMQADRPSARDAIAARVGSRGVPRVTRRAGSPGFRPESGSQAGVQAGVRESSRSPGVSRRGGAMVLNVFFNIQRLVGLSDKTVRQARLEGCEGGSALRSVKESGSWCQ